MDVQAQMPETLLAAVAGGDHAAFEALYAATSSRLFGLVLRIVRRHDLAEEVLQEAFVQIWRRAETYRSERGEAIAWMFGVARYAAIDRLRRQRRELATTDADPENLLPSLEAGGQAGPSIEATKTIFQCLEELDELPRKAILLAYYHGYTHEELAEALGAPLGTVKSWIRRSLARLKVCMET